MTDQPLFLHQQQPAEPMVVAPTASRGSVLWGNGLGFVLLAAAIFYVWQYPTDAPKDLARYARNNPPAEAQLRIRFPGAKQAALGAKQPDVSDAPFIGPVWERAQGVVTIPQGEVVVVGNPSAIRLVRAQSAPKSGDVAAAVDAVELLEGKIGQAMADGLDDAKALLASRAALANMADHA